MASDHAPRRFDFGHPAVVGAPFVFAGHEYAPGDAFPYERLGLGRWEMHGYWLGGLVSFVAEAPVAEVTISMPGVALDTPAPHHLTRAERRARR